MAEKFIRLAALSGAVTVVIGAFGAHALKQHLTEYQIAIYEKGVQYQFIHTLAVMVIGAVMQRREASKWLSLAGWLLLAGIVCFSGSLYLLACRNLISLSVAWAGPITPIGGICFVSGWIALFAGIRAGRG